GRNRDAEKVSADIRPRVPDIRMRRVRGENDTGEKDVRLNAAVGEVEVEVVDAAQRDDREFETVVVMDAAEHEGARRVEPFFDDALAASAFLEIAKAGLSLANHARVGCGSVRKLRIEISRVEAEVAECGRAQDDARAASRRDHLLRRDVALQPEDLPRIASRDFGEIDRLIALARERLKVDALFVRQHLAG